MIKLHPTWALEVAGRLERLLLIRFATLFCGEIDLAVLYTEFPGVLAVGFAFASQGSLISSGCALFKFTVD